MGAAVIGVVFVSIFNVITVSLFTTQLSRENLRATQIMVEKMEGLRLYNPSELTNTTVLARSFTNWFSETNSAGLGGGVGGDGAQYTGTITISPVPFNTDYSDNMSEVTITLNWVSGGNGSMTHTRTMSTFYSNNGMANYVFNKF